MKRLLLAAAVAASLAVAPAALAQSKSKPSPKPKPAPECGCKDLPDMIKELNEQEFLQKYMQSLLEYFPGKSIPDIETLQNRAAHELNVAMYGASAAAAAGTTSGAHPAMGTRFADEDCPIVEYVYDEKGKAVLDKEGNKVTQPTSEETYRNGQCAAFIRYTFVHERVHQATCKRVPKKSWDSAYFYARDDAAAYKAGADALRAELKPLLAKCNWDVSTKNRLPDVNEAKNLVKRAANARPRRKK